MNTKTLRTLGVAGAMFVAASFLAAPVADAANPKTMADEAFITISGTVDETKPDGFVLDYGKGEILVEMDDFDFFDESRKLLERDQVSVVGRIDADLFERRSIEASSVFVEDLQSTFFANSADEEDFDAWTIAVPVQVGRYEVTGTVKRIDGSEIVLNIGPGTVRVDTRGLPTNPLDDEGFMRIGVGDRVKAGGTFDDNLIDENEIDATWLIKLGK